jgi:hypothetical protein
MKRDVDHERIHGLFYDAISTAVFTHYGQMFDGKINDK